MFVKAVKYYGGTDGDADVTVSDGQLGIICFCCDCRHRVSDPITGPLHCEFVSEVQTAGEPEAAIQKTDAAHYSYRIQGLLLDRAAGLVQAGGLRFCIEPGLIPKDIPDRTFISFSTLRTDLWQHPF